MSLAATVKKTVRTARTEGVDGVTDRLVRSAVRRFNVDVEPLLGTRYPLDRIHDAFESAGSRRGVKTLVTP